VQRGAGVPLLMEELAVLSRAGGAAAAVCVPDIVRATAHELAGRLSPPGRALLEAAAAVGMDVRGEVLASLMPDGEPADLVEVDLLIREGEHYRFRHPLFQEAVYEDIPAVRRQQLHERIAAVIAKTDDNNAELVAAHLERADHAEAALSVLDAAAEEARLSGQLGRSATLRLGALSLARRHYTLAGLKDELENLAIWELFAVGRWSELDPLLRSAWERRHRFSTEERSRFAAVSCKYLFWTGSIDEALATVAEELADLERAGASDLCGPLLLEAAMVAFYIADRAKAREFIRRTAEVARRIGDRELEIQGTLADSYVAYGEHGDPQVTLARVRAAAATARARGFASLNGTTQLMLTLLTSASRGTGELGLAPDQSDMRWRIADMHEASYRLLEGDTAASEAVFGKIRQGYELRLPTMMAWVEAKEAWLPLHRGDLEEARRLLSGSASSGEAARHGLIGAERSAALGWLSWEEGRLEEASAYLGDACGEDVLSMYNATSPGLPFLALRVDALTRLGRADEAAKVIATAESLDLTHARFVAAALAVAKFRQTPGPELAFAAETAAKAAPWPWLAALAGCWRGELLHDALAAEASRDQFAAIGASRGVRRTEAVLRQLGVTASRRERGEEGLSAREMEIAELVAEGLNNPAIARRLFLSRATVASHVASILRKLGFSSRSQIAAWLVRRDGTPDGTPEA
jgi:DNA-binding CsgD family transcriptional regulator